MKNKHDIIKDDILDNIKDFEDYLTDIVMDLHNIKGMAGNRQRHVFYRKLLWEIRDKIAKL